MQAAKTRRDLVNDEVAKALKAAGLRVDETEVSKALKAAGLRVEETGRVTSRRNRWQTSSGIGLEQMQSTRKIL